MVFNQENYKRTGWQAAINTDNGLRLIIRVATGRKYWPIYSEIINPELKQDDPAISALNQQLYGFTHPMIDRFMQELEVMLKDIYNQEIKLIKPNNHL